MTDQGLTGMVGSLATVAAACPLFLSRHRSPPGSSRLASTCLMLRFLLCLGFALLLTAGCETDPSARPVAAPGATGDEPASGLPFRRDGTLTFSREDGQEIVTISIEIADGDSATQRGLMDRPSLPERSGMLFLMPRTQQHSFWMANTPLSLDITFVSPDSVVLNTAKYTTPYSSKSVSADGLSRFVVETEAGFADTYGITAGDRVRWSRD